MAEDRVGSPDPPCVKLMSLLFAAWLVASEREDAGVTPAVGAVPGARPVLARLTERPLVVGPGSGADARGRPPPVDRSPTMLLSWPHIDNMCCPNA